MTLEGVEGVALRGALHATASLDSAHGGSPSTAPSLAHQSSSGSTTGSPGGGRLGRLLPSPFRRKTPAAFGSQFSRWAGGGLRGLGLSYWG